MHKITLYQKAKSGNIVQWSIWTEGADICTEYGIMDGAFFQLARKTAAPKNVGKKNETTGEQQAELEAFSMMNHKLDTKYVRTLYELQSRLDEKGSGRISPMLAKDKLPKQLVISKDFPIYIQPKLDGVRCLAYKQNGKVVLMSRGNKPFNIPHIQEQMEKVFASSGQWDDSIVFDGELYIHGVGFQSISSLIKKQREGSELLEFHIYDAFTLSRSEPWTLRINYLNDLTFGLTLLDVPNIKSVLTFRIDRLEEINRFHDLFVNEGYEGAIVRLPNGTYEAGYRSSNLIKIKKFEDEEFTIIDYVSGVGKFKDCVIWICESKDKSKTFYVVPKGTMQEKKEWLETASESIGQKLKVRFFGYTDDGQPRFPVGIGTRLPEDM